jgi:hypothetical protein
MKPLPPRDADTDAGRPEPAGPRREERDAELGSAGWERRFTGGPPRLAEVTELYRGLGWEVLLDELLPEELPESCGDCMLALGTFRIVYTRRPEEAPERGDSE